MSGPGPNLNLMTGVARSIWPGALLHSRCVEQTHLFTEVVEEGGAWYVCVCVCVFLANVPLVSLFLDASRQQAVDLYMAFNSGFEADS